jgi:starch phosphorylase
MSVTSSPDHTPHRELRDAILRHVRYTLARTDGLLPARSLLKPVSLAVRDLLVDRMLDTEQRYREADAKRLYYLSMEHLPGRFLGDNLCNLRLTGVCREILAEFGAELDDVLDQEPDPGLGNGGLGRLAACFMESLATLGLPGFGYGIDYEYGLFRQEITNGYQRERPDRWKEQGTPGLIERVDEPTLIPIYGGVEDTRDSQGVRRRVWVDYKAVIGVPNDLPVAGYGGRTVNYVRLFAARSSEEFDLEVFNQGDYIRAVEAKIAYENISRVLYPSDNVSRGKELRLLQEYFLVACAIRDIVRRYRHEHRNFDDLPAKVAIQMNDTHPALAVAELMRVLVDGYEIEWKRAWEMTEATLAYTNHTLLPEALEKWPVSLLQYVLPRHMEIIYLINEQLLAEVTRSWPDDAGRLARVSLIEEGQEKQVRMANLAVVGSHSVNGVSEMHTDLLKSSLFADFHQLWPQKFNNKTNGVAPRRWLLKANPELAALLTQAVGNDSWIADLARLRAVEVFADDVGLQSDFVRIKRDNKTKLAAFIRQKTGLVVNVDSIFDVHIKRIHQYKRQLLNVLRIIREYLCLVDEGGEVLVPRTYIFAGKAAPGYWAAKQIIKLIHNVARTINGDPRVRDRMRVVFLPDYKVSLAELIIPAADLSQQIATAGMER